MPSAVRGLPLYGQRCAGCHGQRGEGTARAAAIGRRDFLFDRSPVELFRMLAGMKRQDGPARVGAHGQTVATASKAASSHAPSAREWSEQERLGRRRSAVVIRHDHRPPRCRPAPLSEELRRLPRRGGERGWGGRPEPAKKPADFTDARRMLAGSTELYTAKIRRGGMGTGMPYWGSIFTEEELEAVVDYVWGLSLGIAR